MISIKNVSKTFFSFSFPFKAAEKTATEALRVIDIEIPKGDIVALVGRNGAGKTTLLKILCTLILPDSGAVTIDGVNVIAHPSAALGRIGFAGADERSFYQRLTGRQNMQLFATLCNIRPKDIRTRVAATLELTGMTPHADTPFRHYSSGMKQRLSLARCLLHDPPVLILDEPSKALDPLLQNEFFDLLRNSLVKDLGKTVLFSTHNLNEAAEQAERTVLIDSGRIIFDGVPPGGADSLRQIMRNRGSSAGIEEAQP